MTARRSQMQELESMISGLRVSELHTLLTWAGLSRSGKKNDLVLRAYELLRTKYNVQLENKVRELYYLARPNLMNYGANMANAQPGSNINLPPQIASNAIYSSSYGHGHHIQQHQMPPQAHLNQHHSHSSLMNNHHSHLLYQNTLNSTTPNSDHRPSIHQGINFSSHFHNHRGGLQNTGPCACRDCDRLADPLQPTAATIPPVAFKLLPFYDTIDSLLKPSGLISGQSIGVNQYSMTFKLTVEQADSIAMSQTSPNVFNRQILLRFCNWDATCDQDDNFPQNCIVKVNDKPAQLPPIPHNPNKPPHELKRPGRPVDITPLSKISPYHENVLSVSWTTDRYTQIKAHVIQITVSERLNSQILMSRLEAKGVREPEKTRSMIREKLACDADADIATDVMRGSLICPLGKTRMRRPCRSEKCQHIQCFDALIYLAMNEKKPSWLCPVCDKPALYQDLLIDGMLIDILKSVPEETSEVEFYRDGSYGLVNSKKSYNDTKSSSPLKKRLCVSSSDGQQGSIQIQDVDDDDDNCQHGLHGCDEDKKFKISTNSILQPPQLQQPQSKPRDEIEIVTISDSSDDEDTSMIPINPPCQSRNTDNINLQAQDLDQNNVNNDDEETEPEDCQLEYDVEALNRFLSSEAVTTNSTTADVEPSSPASSSHTICSVYSPPEFSNMSTISIDHNSSNIDTALFQEQTRLNDYTNKSHYSIV